MSAVHDGHQASQRVQVATQICNSGSGAQESQSAKLRPVLTLSRSDNLLKKNAPVRMCWQHRDSFPHKREKNEWLGVTSSHSGFSRCLHSGRRLVLLTTSGTSTHTPTPHDIPNSWRRRDDGGRGVVTEPDRLVALQALGPELVQRVELSLSNIQQRQNTVRIPMIYYCVYHCSADCILSRQSQFPVTQF